MLFAFNVTMISLRFYFYPRTFKASFLHPTESLFIPAAVISFGTILINITQYGVDTTGYWLERTMAVMYWLDCGLAVCFSIGIYLIMYVHSFPHFFSAIPRALLLIRFQVEHPNLHNLTNDARLDLSRISSPDHRTACGRSRSQNLQPQHRPQRNSLRVRDTGDWVYGELDDILRLPLPPHDAKIA